MNLKIKEVEKEIDEKNFEKALGILDEIKAKDDGYELSLLFKVTCLFNLKRYGECLEIIGALLKNNPNEELLLADKVMCHYFLDDEKQALKSLRKLESVVNKNDAHSLCVVSQLCNLVNDPKKAINYADLSLEIDENFESALIEKAQAASQLKDHGMMIDCANKLISLKGDDESPLSLTLPFVLKLFAGDYRGCLDVVNSFDELDGEIEEMMKVAIYKEMYENLNIEIYISAKVESGIDDALRMLFDYLYEGIEGGPIGDAYYVIIKKS
ncbi:MAG: hypothetical protein IJ122_00875 [Methanobrevibacter sp.]|nr:hypothetical protein [Methanobrevibacter sp.]